MWTLEMVKVFFAWLKLSPRDREEAIEKWEALQALRAGFGLINGFLLMLFWILGFQIVAIIFLVLTWAGGVCWMLGSMDVHKEQFIKDQLKGS